MRSTGVAGALNRSRYWGRRVGVLHLQRWKVPLLNVVASAALHAGTGWLAHRIPLTRLQDDGPLLRLRPAEAGGRIYERRLGIQRWKDRLPEAGALFDGGVSKRALPGRDTPALQRFVAETRRAERAHWWAVAGAPVIALCNPPVGAAAMLLYGVASNGPFIAVQRYNRARLLRLLARRAQRSGGREPGRP
jgi:glycosyl-4,4'-diaponeurosporenoate acyltransferase